MIMMKKNCTNLKRKFPLFLCNYCLIHGNVTTSLVVFNKLLHFNNLYHVDIYYMVKNVAIEIYIYFKEILIFYCAIVNCQFLYNILYISLQSSHLYVNCWCKFSKSQLIFHLSIEKVDISNLMCFLLIKLKRK